MKHLIEQSLHIALQAHAGQIDKAAQPYILHPLRVMAKMDTDEEMAVALLHDVIEDSGVSGDSLLQAGIPSGVVDAVQCLTKRDSEDYDQFIQRVLTNDLAVKVKIADIEDNLDVLRLETLGSSDLERVRKYHTTWKVLDSRLTLGIPPIGSDQTHTTDRSVMNAGQHPHFVPNLEGTTILAGVDLAWQSEKNPSAIAYGSISNDVLSVTTIEPAIYGIDSVLDMLNGIGNLKGIAIDAPLIINNKGGQRDCEKEIGRSYGSRGASCHTSNTRLYPNAKSVYLSKRLLESGFKHLKGKRWQIECYPHPALIEIFGLKERLKYKKGTVDERRSGQKTLAEFLRNLSNSNVLRLIINGEASSILEESHIESLRGQPLKSNEDALDSVLCLYIAGLHAIEYSAQLFGVADSGYIWVPQGTCI